MFKTILAPTDLSGHARDAVFRAARIAQQSGAALHLVHVQEAGIVDRLRHLVSDPPADLRSRLDAAARFGMEELAHALQQELGVQPTLHFAEGELVAEIRGAAERTGADLVVLGARGASVARHLLLGSTAERLLAEATQSMLVVRTPAEVPYRDVLVPVDFSPASLAAVRRARAIAPDARIHALHAYEAPYEGKLRQAGVEARELRGYVQAAEKEAALQMAGLVAAGGPGIASMLLHGHPLAHTLDQEEELGCQLVVVGKGSGSRATDIMLGSLSRRVLAQSRVDVLMSV